MSTMLIVRSASASEIPPGNVNAHWCAVFVGTGPLPPPGPAWRKVVGSWTLGAIATQDVGVRRMIALFNSCPWFATNADVPVSVVTLRGPISLELA